MTKKEDLINFENWCVYTYKQGKLRSPLHLSGSIDGNLEDFLIQKKLFIILMGTKSTIILKILNFLPVTACILNTLIQKSQKDRKFFLKVNILARIPNGRKTILAL